MLNSLSKVITGFGFLLCWVSAQADLSIEITKGVKSGLPIAVVPFSWEGQSRPPHNISDIVAANLARSGHFAIIPKKDFLSNPHTRKDVIFKDWRLLKTEALVIGEIKQLGANKYQVEFRLFDIFKEKQLAGFRYTVGRKLVRKVAHQISDIIYEKLTGEPGAFNTRIAYITKQSTASGSTYKLKIADSDGYGPVSLVTSREPLMSPAWSADGRKIAYVSFEHKRSKVFVQNINSGKRSLVAQFPGINSAPAFSPDGRSLAMTLSKDGNAEIYVMNLATRKLKRITRNPAIDTEPAWSLDGSRLVFTSDRAGSPQIYDVSVSGGNVRRLTFEGSYNARPSYSADGKTITLVSRSRGRYHIAVLDIENSGLQIITSTLLDESPSFAPNGRIILYAAQVGGKGVLASVSADGRVKQLFKFRDGDVREPAWSPYNRELQYKE
ncbi:MAG: Tol-Pal system beta propeller repeat protein TolB [Gammaproteobacteria bacterium]|nr:MAG: Tol-Pal system beta propeller repeat protein TolB [Gammaproteobacteria bacterium]